MAAEQSALWLGLPARARAFQPGLPRVNVLVLLALIPTLMIVGLLAAIGVISVQVSVTDSTLTMKHYVDLYTDPTAYRTFLNTAIFSLVTLAVALAVGIPIAWLVTRTDLPGKNAILSMMTLGLVIPGFFTAMGWLFMFHPRIGVVNQGLMQVLGLQSAPLSIVSIHGMGIVQGLNLAALVFILTSASLRNMDASLEESAQLSGASFAGVLRRVTLPLAFPGILAAALYTLTIGMGAFDVPAIIGMSNRIFTFSTYIYQSTHPLGGLPEYGTPAAFSSFMLALALLLSWWYSRVLIQARKYQIVTGKNYKPRIHSLGPWCVAAWLFIGAYLVFAQLLPLLMLAWTALLPYLQVPSPAALSAVTLKNFQTLSWPLVMRGAGHTAVLAVAAPTLVLIASVIFSRVILRSRSRLRLAFDFVAFLPHAVPSIVFGLGALMISLFVINDLIDLYGTVTLLLIVFSLTHLSFGTRVTNSALINIHTELEEAASVAGASTFTMLKRIVAPLLRPAFVYAWLWLALLTVRELTLSTLLFSPRNITLSVVSWSLFSAGQLGQSAAVGLLLMCCLLPLVLLYYKFGTAAERA